MVAAMAASGSRRAQVSAAYRAAAAAELTSSHRSAIRCLIAWYEPIVRANCLRPLMYLSVVSKHHCATPSCSEASSAVPVCSAAASAASAEPVATRDGGTPENLTCARDLVMSSANTGDTSTPVAARETVCSPSPSGPAAGTTSTSASATPATPVTSPARPSFPIVTPATASPGAVDSGTTSAAVSSPAASAGSVSVSPAVSSAMVASTALDKNGTGATARPISSITTAASRAPAPAPPSSSGTSNPATPRSAANSFHTPEKSGGAGSYSRITASGGHRSASKRRTLSRRASSVSEYSK